ncbi:MAG: helicase [Violenivirus raptis]|uniref:Replication-associated protein n=1 Tax=Circoviridae sp. TaxID=1954248 RepID=A0A345N2Q5_9VIRU|nr:MAG: helicase [Circoviridae sp.]
MGNKRDYCFTDYILDEDFLKQLPYKYLCYGREVCPTSGRKHLQVYIYFKHAKSFESVQKLIYPRNFRECSGSALQNKIYCSKEGDFFEFGECPKQGARNDIKNIRESIQQGNYTMRDIVSSATSFQSIRIAEVNMKYFEPRRDWLPEVYWFYGASGTGKTRQAYEMCEDPYVCMATNKWWEGYDGHEDVIIDDYRRDFSTFSILLKLLDRYEFRVECKGGSRQLRAKRIIITSPRHPVDTWEGRTGEEIKQLTRRIKEIKEFV